MVEIAWRLKPNWPGSGQPDLWNRTSPVSSVDVDVLRVNISRLEQIAISLPMVEENIVIYKDRIKAFNEAMTVSRDTNEIRQLAEERNITTRNLESAETERDVLKLQQKTALKIVNQNRDEMAKFYTAGPYMSEDKASLMTLIGMACVVGGAAYLIRSPSTSRQFRSLMKQSPVTAAFR